MPAFLTRITRHLLVAGAALVINHTAASAQQIEELAPSQVEARVSATQDGRPLVLHYSSDDGSCSHCVTSNQDLRDAADALAEEIDFASVILNPWRAFFDSPNGQPVRDFQSGISFDLTGIPATILFVDGKPIRMWNRRVEELQDDLAAAYEIARRQNARPRGSVAVAIVPVVQMPIYLRALSQDKPVFLTMSSTDADCIQCQVGNSVIGEASRFLSEDYHFARVDFSPWRSSAESPFVSDLLEGTGKSLTGLPLSVVIYKDQVLGTVATNGRDLRHVLSQALPALLQQAR